VRARVVIPVLVAAAAVAPSAGASPSLGAERAHEQAVLAQVDQINRHLDAVVQAWDGAQVRLSSVQRQLRANEWRLRVARENFRVAERRLERRVVQLYKDGRPDAVSVLVGATSMSDLVDRLEAAQTLSRQDAGIAEQASHFQRVVRQREALLQRQRAARARAVARLDDRRRQIGAALASEQRLLASIHTSIQRLEAEQAARARRLAAEERARVARQAALARQRALARAVRPPVAAPTPAPRSSPPAPTPAAPTPQPDPSPAPAPPAPVTPPPAPAPSVGGGHPQAAAIAARYLGVPYRWGGASPAGFDCSGLVTYVYAQLGISLPHYTVSQWNATIPIPVSALQPGDLVFFAGLSHVGIYIGNNQIIHAPHTGTVVQVASLTGWFAANLDGARRVP
jgi:cell wall-associated NlpC family hydrolase